MADKRKNKNAEWRRNIANSLKRKRTLTEEEKEKRRSENKAILALGALAGRASLSLSSPNSKEVNKATSRLVSVLNDRKAYEQELSTNKKFRDIVKLENAAKDFLEKRAKYESILNTTDSTPEMRQKAADKFKKRFGPEIADIKVVAQKKQLLSAYDTLKRNAVVQNSLGKKANSKRLRNAALIGLGTVGAVRTAVAIRRSKDDKKNKIR